MSCSVNPLQTLIELFRSESAPSAQIREYFTNYCDCDIAEWLIAQLIANNQEVVDKVNELLEARDLYPIKREAIHPKNGQLVKAFCQGSNRVGYYSINTPTVKSYELRTIQTNSSECEPYLVLDTFQSEGGLRRGLEFHQSNVGVTEKRQTFIDNPSNFTNDPKNPLSSTYDSSGYFYFSEQYVSAKGYVGSSHRYLRATDYDAVDGWERVSFVEQYDPAKTGYVTKMNILFDTVNENNDVPFDFDTTVGFSTGDCVCSFGFHRYDTPTMLVNPDGPANVTSYKFHFDYEGYRTPPRYDNIGTLNDGLRFEMYPFRPNDDAVILTLRYIVLDTVKHPNLHSTNNSVVDGVDPGEYRFDVTSVINDYLANKPLSEYAAVNDEEGRTLPRFLTKIAKNEASQPIGYEISLRTEIVDNNIKVFFNDLMVLDLFFKKMPPGNRNLTAGFFSASTGYVNHFSVGLKTT